MDLPKGWISRQITRLEKEYLTWPDWMKREIPMQVNKTIKYQNYVEQGTSLGKYFRAWATTEVTTSETGKIKTETEIRFNIDGGIVFISIPSGTETNFAEFLERSARTIRLTLEESKNG